jgi:hypothetical protein
MNMTDELSYEQHPIVSLANIALTIVTCLFGVPVAFILTWKTYKHAQLFSISIQIRVQIVAWSFLLTNILLMNLYLIYSMFFTQDDDSLKNVTLYEFVLSQVGDPTPEFNYRIIFGKFQQND